MITLFSTPKDFKEEFSTIQKNAFSNWRSLSDKMEILIMGSSEGAEEAAKSIGAKFLGKIPTTSRNTPTIPGLFETAEKYSKNQMLCYLNSDILLPQNFLQVIKVLNRLEKNFLAIGHRWDLDVDKIIDFNNQSELREFWFFANQNSIQHACTGIDYFIFKKRTFKKLPQLVIGRIGWDNWLLWKARRMMIPVIDITYDLQVMHQNHSYKFKNYKTQSDTFLSDGAKANVNITKNKTLNILDANYQMENGEIKKKNSKDFFNRNLGKLPTIFYEFSFFLIIFKKLYRFFNK